MTAPAGLAPFFSLTGTLLDPNSGEPLLGTVTFTPTVQSLLVAGAPKPFTALPQPETVSLDRNGDFTLNLVATDDPATNPTGNWTYTVSFSLRTVNGKPVKLSPYNITAPSGQSKNLAHVAQVSPGNGAPITVGPPNQLSVGTVTTTGPGTTATATITGTAPTQTLSLAIPRGDVGPQGNLGPTGPTGPPLGVGTTITTAGPAAPGTVGPQGLKGDKGDPGGWTTPTGLVAGTNLNDVITSGLYLNPQANVAAGPSNSTNGGHLEVIASAGYIYQRYTPIQETREVYVRHRTSGLVWSAWTVLNTVRVDQTAGRAIYTWDDLNNREQLTYGDTGWRRITAPGDIASLPNAEVKIRRVGSEVEAQFFETAAGISGAGTNVTVGTLPVGFRMSGSTAGDASMAVALVVDQSLIPITTSAFGCTSSGAGALLLRVTSGKRHYATLKFQTTDAWPTTLPGVAVGSIPNT